MFKAVREAKGRIVIGPLIDQITALLAYHDMRPTPRQWDDPYLYGYFSGITTMPLKMSSNGRLSGDSTCKVQMWGWEHLTGITAKAFLHRAEELASSRDAEYARGMNAGILWGALVTGTARRDHPAVREAIEAGRQLGSNMRDLIGSEASELQDAAAYAMTRDLWSYLRNREASAA